MKIIKKPQEIQKELKSINQNKTIGFIPTMGALHNGHISLIKQARKENDIVVVSVFINPTQFLANEDFSKYPQTTQNDIKISKLCAVDILFMPMINDIYTKDEVIVKAPKKDGFILEGYNRPGHFDGMLQIVLKLLSIVSPNKAYFGKKDAQQLYLIKKMVKNFYLDLDIIECDIVREDDGLALSSRNIYLTNTQRDLALNISKSLKIAKKTIESGILDCNSIELKILDILNHKDISIEYIAFVDREFNKIDTIKLQQSIILIAIKIDTTRLIDNIWI